MVTLPKVIDFRHWCGLGKSLDVLIEPESFTGIDSSIVDIRPVALSFDCSKSKRFGLLQLRIKTSVDLQCQRCLDSFSFPIESEARAYLVDEDQIELLDDDVDYHVLGEDGQLDMIKLVQDEIELVVPMVPKHPVGHCQPKTVFGELPQEALEDGKNPFAVLTDLKKRT